MHRHGEDFRRDMDRVVAAEDDSDEETEGLGRILCTVALGLRKSTTVGGEANNCLLLKAKVVLDDVLLPKESPTEMDKAISQNDIPSDDDDMYL